MKHSFLQSVATCMHVHANCCGCGKFHVVKQSVGRDCQKEAWLKFCSQLSTTPPFSNPVSATDTHTTHTHMQAHRHTLYTHPLMQAHRHTLYTHPLMHACKHPHYTHTLMQAHPQTHPLTHTHTHSHVHTLTCKHHARTV